MATTDRLREPFRTHVEQLLAAGGGRVTLVSGFRTFDQQVALRKANGCPDVMRSPASACRVPTAIPGTSKHEKGLAVDFGGDLELVARLAPKFLMHRTVPGEAWHYEPTDPQQPEDDDMTKDEFEQAIAPLVEAVSEIRDNLRKITPDVDHIATRVDDIANSTVAP